MKRLVFWLFAAGLASALFASPVSEETAFAAAEGFLAQSGVAKRALSSVEKVESVSNLSNLSNLWIAHLSPSGHIVLAGSTKCSPVISFSSEDFAMPSEDTPFYEKLVDADAWVAATEADDSIAEHSAWTTYTTVKPSNSQTAKPSAKRLLGAPTAETSEPYVAPFLNAAWYQTAPYNDFSPLSVPCGCMATAGGQEHRYWQWPWRYEKTRTYAHSLKDHANHVIRVNGLEPFDYSKMEAAYSDATFRAADKRAAYECAHLILWMQSLVKMIFAPGASGGRQKLCAEAESYWFEKGSVMNKTRNGYETLWQAIRDDLDFGSPIQVNTPGHQMVIDGYAIEGAGTDDEKDWVNINYGWGNPTTWVDLLTEIESRSLADFQIGYRPQKRVQFEPVRKVNEPSFELTWRIPNCYTNRIDRFTLQTAKLGETTAFRDDFSASTGEEGGLRVENGYLAGYRGVQNSTYTYPETHYVMPGARLSFDVQYRYMRIHAAYVEARIDGGGWETLYTIDMSDGLDRNDNFDAPVPQAVDLSAYAGKRIQLRFRLHNDWYAHWGTSSTSDFRIDNVVLSGIKDVDGETLETREIAVADDMPARYEASLENLESGASYAVTVTPVMKEGEEGAGAVASAFVTTIGEPAADPVIESVSVVGAGLEILQEGFFAECGIGRVNPIVVHCSNAVALHAYPSHLTVLPDEKVSVEKDGDTFTISVDATEMDPEWHNDMMILTLVAENSDGTETAKNLMLRFNSTRQILSGTFDVAEGGETDDPAWFCGDETIIDAKGKALKFLGNAFMGSGNVTLTDSVGGGSFEFGGLDYFRGTLKYGSDVAVTLPASSPLFSGTIILTADTELSCALPAAAALVIENNATITLSNASLACPVTGSGTVSVSSGASAITGSVGDGVRVRLSGGRLDIAAGVETNVTMDSDDASLWITIADIDVAFGYSSQVGQYSAGDIHLVDSEGNFLDNVFFDYFEPGAFTYDGTANTWKVADGETSGNYSDVNRWSLGRLPQDGEYAKIVNAGGTTIVMDAPEAVEIRELRVAGSGAAMIFAAPSQDGEYSAISAETFSCTAPVNIATALFQADFLEPQAAIAISGDARLSSTIDYSCISHMQTADLQDGAKWRGTMTVSGALPTPYNSSNWFNPNLYGNEQSKVRFNGASGYLTVNTVFTPQVELVDDGDTPALDWNNGSSTSTATFRSISGTGTFRTSTTALTEKILLNDISEFTGSLDIRKKTVAIGEAMPEGDDVISGGGRLFIDSAATIASGETWTAYDGIYLCDGCDLTVSGTLDANLVIHESGATLNLADGGLVKISSLPTGEYSPTLNFAAGTLRVGADMTLSKTVNFCAYPTQEKWTTIDTQGHTLTLGEDFFSGTGDVLFSSPADQGGTVVITALPDAFTGTIILDGSTSVVFPNGGDMSDVKCGIVVENTELSFTPKTLGRTIVSAGGKVTVVLDAKTAVTGYSVADKVTLLAGGVVEFADPDGNILATIAEAGADVAYDIPYNVWIANVESDDGASGDFADVACWSKGELPAEGDNVLVYLFADTTMTIPDDAQFDLGVVTVRGTGTLSTTGGSPVASDDEEGDAPAARRTTAPVAASALVNEIPVVIATDAFQPATLRPAAALEIDDGGLLTGTIDYAYAAAHMRTADLQDAAKWNGLVTVATQMKDFDSDNFGNASSFIRMTGATGWFGQNSESVVAIELVDGEDGTYALNHDNGYGGQTVVVDKITGSGTYATTSANGAGERVLFKDVSEFTGSFDLNYKSVTIGEKLSTTDGSSYGRLFVRSSATIAPAATWRANYGIWLGEGCDLTVKGMFNAPITVDGAGAVLTLADGGVIETASAIAARYAPTLNFAAGTYRITADVTESQTVNFCAGKGKYTTLDTCGHTLTLGENFFSGSGDVLLTSSEGSGTVVACGISDAFAGRIFIGENTTLRLVLPEKETMLGFPGDNIEFDGGTIVIVDCKGNVVKEGAGDASYSNSQNFWYSASGEGSLLDPNCWTKGTLPSQDDDILVFLTQDTTLTIDNEELFRLGTVTVRGTGTLTIEDGTDGTDETDGTDGTVATSATLPESLVNFTPVVFNTDAFQPEELKPQATLSFGDTSDAMLDGVIRYEYFSNASAILADTRWKGDAIVENVTAESFPMHTWGTASSRIILSGVTGPAQNGDVTAEVILVDDDYDFAWNINPAPNRHVNIHKISGSGTLMASHTAASMSVTEFWDAMEFSGSIIQGELGGGRIQVCERQSSVWGDADQILVEPGFGIRLADGKSWTPGSGGIALYGTVFFEGAATFNGVTTLYDGATLKFEDAGRGTLVVPDEDATSASLPLLACSNLTFTSGTVNIAFGDDVILSDGQTLITWQEGTPTGTFEFAALQENLVLAIEENSLVVRAVAESPEVDENTIDNRETDIAQSGANFTAAASTFKITIPETEGFPAASLVRLDSISLGTNGNSVDIRYIKIAGEEGEILSRIVNGTGRNSEKAFTGYSGATKQTFMFDDDCLLKVGKEYSLSILGESRTAVYQRYWMVTNKNFSAISQTSTTTPAWRISQEVSYRKVHTAKTLEDAAFSDLVFKPALPENASGSFYRIIAKNDSSVTLDEETSMGALTISGTLALDGASLSVAEALKLKEGAVLRAASDTVFPSAIYCWSGASAVIYVDEGATLTVTGRIYGAGAIVKRGAGRLVLECGDAMTFPVCEEGVIELGGGKTHSLGALRDFSMFEGYVVGEGSSVAIAQTRVEYAEGMAVVENVPFGSVDIVTVAGATEAMALDGSTATYGDGVVRVDGDVATFDWEFNGNFASTGYIANALTPDETTVEASISGGDSLLIRKHPYYNSATNGHGLWTWADEWTIATKFSAPVTAETNVYVLAVGNSGSDCIGLASCAEEGKMMLFYAANRSTAFESLLEFDVEDRSSIQHLYTLSKTSDGKISVYLDGALMGEANINNPVGTLQVGSLHGGITAAVGIAQPSASDAATMDFLKIYNFGISDAMRSKLVAQYAYGMCSVTWQDDDGTLLEYDEGVAFGEMPSYDGETPHKASTAEYDYEFAGWTPEISEVVADATYIAIYTASRRSYTVTWQDEDGTLLESDYLEYGSTPAYDGVTPAKAEDTYNTYSFAGWDAEIATVTGDAVYTAVYTRHAKWTGDGTQDAPYTLAAPERIAEIIALAEDPNASIFVLEDENITTTTIYNALPQGYALASSGIYGVLKIVRIFAIAWYNHDGELLLESEAAYGALPIYYGTTPTKDSTPEFDYSHAGWTPDISVATCDTSYTATFTEQKRSYTVTWIIDGSSETETYEYGSTPSHEEPSKAPTAQYTYAFAGWDAEISTVVCDATYTAVFTPHVRSYTVTWNIDGSAESETLAYGATPSHDAPAKAATAQYSYTFTGWTPEIAPVTGDAEYTAQFAASLNHYTVTWLNDDGSVIDTATLAYGETPSHDASAKAATAQYSYTFTGWSPEIAPVSGDATYTATYSSAVNTYTITWKDDDGSIIDTATLAYGATPSHDAPAKAADAQYSYTFAGWSPEIAPVAADAEYTAVFTPNIRSYTVTWLIDGLEERETYEYGATPEHAAPEKEATAEFSYTFERWEPEIVSVTGDAAYTAIFTETRNEYTITWYDEDGTTELATTTVEYGDTPECTAPDKIYAFTGWSPALEPVTGDVAYTAVYDHDHIILGNLKENYEAADGQILEGTTGFSVTVPGGATVTINGVAVTGAGGNAEPAPEPEFSEDCVVETANFTLAEDGVTLATFAELANDAIGADVTPDMIKVYAAETLEDLQNAEPLGADDYSVEKKSAVRTVIKVAPAPSAPARFFKIKFGK